jgi:hypothetical protein
MDNPQPLGDFLGKILKKARPSKKILEGRRLAQKLFSEKFPQFDKHACVHSVKAGVATIEADSSALFQELEGFHKETLLELFRDAGLKVHTVRVKLQERSK